MNSTGERHSLLYSSDDVANKHEGLQHSYERRAVSAETLCFEFTSNVIDLRMPSQHCHLWKTAAILILQLAPFVAAIKGD